MVPKTKYEEDMYANNHTSVWGSYFSRATKQWGFNCCHSCLRNSYCTGEVGRESNDAANTVGCLPTRALSTSWRMSLQAVILYFYYQGAIDAFQERKMLETKPMGNREASNNTFMNRNDVYGESSAQSFDEDKVKSALEKAQSASKNIKLL